MEEGYVSNARTGNEVPQREQNTLRAGATYGDAEQTDNGLRLPYAPDWAGSRPLGGGVDGAYCGSGVINSIDAGGLEYSGVCAVNARSAVSRSSSVKAPVVRQNSTTLSFGSFT